MKSEKALLGWIAVCATCAAAVAIAVPSYGYLVAYPKLKKAIDARFATIDSKIDKLTDQSARTQRSAETTDANNALAQIKSVILPAIGSLGMKIEKTNAAISGDTQKAGAAEAIKSDLASLNTKIEKVLADTKKADAADAIKSGLAALGAKIEKIETQIAQIESAKGHAAAIDALKGEISGIASSQAMLSKAVADLSDKIKQANAQPSSASAGEDLAVIYVSSPHAPAPGSIPMMTVNYERVGSLDDNGQTAAIIERLKPLLKDRKNCTIGVEGYADTLGGDSRNLQLSKQRAEEVSAKLRAAFADQGVKVSDAAWGERRLKIWTKDNTGQRANRRVDIEVSCKD